MANTKKTTRAGTATRSTSTATPTARSGTTGSGGGTGTGTGGGAGVGTQAAPLGIPSGGASVLGAVAASTQTGGVNWANVQQQFPAIAWTQAQLATLMANIALGPQHYPANEYQAMLTQFRNVCSQQIQLFQRLHLGERETVNA